MNGLLASLRFPIVLRGRWSVAAPVGTIDAMAARASDPFRPILRSVPAPRVPRTVSAPPIALPAVAVEPAPDAPAAAPLPPMPVEPSVPVSPAHLADPVGLRVVPFRPSTRWPLRRAAPRIYDPFRGFPHRSAHLADLMDGRTL